MRKRTRRKASTGLNLFQKAALRQAWQADTVRASIHALIGEDVRQLVRQAGSIIYGVVTASEDARIDGDDVDLSAVHDAAKALMEQSSKADFDDALRSRIVSGLAACERLLPRLEPTSIRRATEDIVQAVASRQDEVAEAVDNVKSIGG